MRNIFLKNSGDFGEPILQSALRLTPAKRPNIALIIGSDLRDILFAVRIQKRFPALVDLWFQVPPPFSTQTQRARAPNRIGMAWLKRLAALVFASRSECDEQREVEQRMLGDEIDSLRKGRYVEADIVQDPNASDLIARLRKISPYFILTTENIALGKEVRNCARGLVLSRCDGWLPDYFGKQAIERALYRRDWKKVGSSIVLLGDNPLSSQIVRRATCCLAEDDTPEICLARSGALGTDLMCDVVEAVIRSREIRYCTEAPPNSVVADTSELGNLAMHKFRRGLPRLIRSDLDARHRV